MGLLTAIKPPHLRKENDMSDMEFFTIKKQNEKACLVALEHWLKKHYYNSWTTGGEDKYCNPLIPIRWDDEPDSDWGRPNPVTGIIVLKGYNNCDESVIDDVIDKVIEVLRANIRKESK